MKLLTQKELLKKFGYEIKSYSKSVKDIEDSGNFNSIKVNEFGGVHGYANGKSSRAYVAEERGLIKPGEINKDLGCSAEFIDDNCKEDEWHHVGSRKYHKIVNYYEPETIINWWFDDGGKEKWEKLSKNIGENIGNCLIQESGCYYYLINTIQKGRNFICEKAFRYDYSKPNMKRYEVSYINFTSKKCILVAKLDEIIHYGDWKSII